MPRREQEPCVSFQGLGSHADPPVTGAMLLPAAQVEKGRGWQTLNKENANTDYTEQREAHGPDRRTKCGWP
jgi:hypothetical protein